MLVQEAVLGFIEWCNQMHKYGINGIWTEKDEKRIKDCSNRLRSLAEEMDTISSEGMTYLEELSAGINSDAGTRLYDNFSAFYVGDKVPASLAEGMRSTADALDQYCQEQITFLEMLRTQYNTYKSNVERRNQEAREAAEKAF